MTTTSVRTKKQRREYTKIVDGKLHVCTIRFDDECRNGHNSLGVTGEVYRGKIRRDASIDSCGCLHDMIREVFPEHAYLLPYHLCSTDGPMHYVANSLYWAGWNTEWCKGGPNDPPNLEHFRSTAVWPDATEDDMNGVNKDILAARLDGILADFRAAIERAGLTW